MIWVIKMDSNEGLLFLVSAVEIILIDLVLSGDNAIIIAMACRHLEPERRKWAFLLGASGAILLRIFFASIASFSIMKVPILSFVGGLVLLWIAVKLLIEGEQGQIIEPQRRMRSAVKTIILADVVMSLDNVLAVGAAAHGHVGLLVGGLMLSMTLLMVGSSVLAKLMSRYEFLTGVGAAIIAWVAGDMISGGSEVKNFFPQHISFVIPVVAVLIVFMSAKLLNIRAKKS